MSTNKALLAGLSLAAFLAAAPPSEAAKWSLFGLGNNNNEQNAPPPPAAGDQPIVAAAADSERLGQTEAQMRALTGQVEELTHAVQVLQDQLKRMQDDTDFRLRELEGGKAVARAAPATKPVPAPAAQAQAAPAPQLQPLPDQSGAMVVEDPPVDNGGAQLGAPPKNLGTLAIDAPPNGEQPLDLSSLANGDNGAAQPAPAATDTTTQVASIAPSGDARTDYDRAYAMITGGQYDVAAKSFRQFLATYPSDELAPEAQYWLGESLFAHGDYASAAEEFKSGYQAYPKSKRAPDSLLKLGLSMAGLGYRDEACKMYTLALKQYPQMPNGLRLRVKTEQASASC